MNTLDIPYLDEIVRWLSQSFVIPDELQGVVKAAIKALRTTSLSDNTIESMLRRPQSALDTVKYILGSAPPGREAILNTWRGRIEEWIACWEYNQLKNDSRVLTIVNPDATSKSDLIQLIQRSDGAWFWRPGPDVKAAAPVFVLKEFERTVRDKPEVSFLDVNDHLAHPELFTPAQQDRLAHLRTRKQPVRPVLSPMDRQTIFKEFIGYVQTGRLPSERHKAVDLVQLPAKATELPRFREQMIQRAFILQRVTMPWPAAASRRASAPARQAHTTGSRPAEPFSRSEQPRPKNPSQPSTPAPKPSAGDSLGTFLGRVVMHGLRMTLEGFASAMLNQAFRKWSGGDHVSGWRPELKPAAPAGHQATQSGGASNAPAAVQVMPVDPASSPPTETPLNKPYTPNDVPAGRQTYWTGPGRKVPMEKSKPSYHRGDKK